MVGVGVVLVVVGAGLVTWGNENLAFFGWLTLGWGFGGLAAALILVIRTWWH
jgi:hypothetical protein